MAQSRRSRPSGEGGYLEICAFAMAERTECGCALFERKKIYAQMDFQGCRGDKKWGRVTCPSAMIKTVGRESRDCVHGHGCESGVTQVMHGDIYSILSD